ncbi:MAG: class I mannose-6-phosphate isomerase [Erysipelothrix sp.]|nr:class I mannose-6-phosphate isomerase [Erysipelothrix sp.]
MSIHKIKASSKDYLWGGTKLITEYGKKTDQDIMAESWEISSHTDGPSILVDENMTLKEYTDKYGAKVVGTKGAKFKEFPILVKFIDAKDVLSIQVHPDDAYALENENQFGKNEMWYILEAEPGATIYYGVKETITKEAFKQAIEDDKILDVLNKVEVKPGDVIYVEAETIHAIGKGIVLCEIQQNSNVTYRVYDFARKDKDGKTRELHIQQSVDVSNLNKIEPDFTAHGAKESLDGFSKQLLIDSQYFTTTLYEVESKASFNVDETSFVAFICLEGKLTVTNKDKEIQLVKGESIFIDANSDLVEVSGKGNFIHVSV